jgi:glycosyltransferase involved in cell wall biosynthesis
MLLIIQIPCFNEEHSLPGTIADLPREIPGVDRIEYLIINDGSKDRTVEVAHSLGVRHVVSFSGNRGLAAAFRAGIERCLELGADIIVNTDADNQYCGADIPKLVQPILEHQADVVVGDRQTDSIAHFSWVKKKLQRLGTNMVRALSGTEVNDAVSGFRAFSSEAARQINIVTDFSYTIENLIQLGASRMKVISVPIRTNPKSRDSRLFKSIPHFIRNQLATIIKAVSTYKALKVFSILAMLFLAPGLLGVGRFLVLAMLGHSDGHIQSLVLSAICLIISFMLFVLGIMADLIATNRRLLELILQQMRKSRD